MPIMPGSVGDMSTALERTSTDLVTSAVASAYELLVRQWLDTRRTPSTRDAYRNDWRAWERFLSTLEVHPLAVTFLHLERWDLEMREPVEGRPLAPSTRARRLSTAASFYRYAVKAGAIDRNPADLVDRPQAGVDHVKLTPSIDRDQLAALTAAGESAQDRLLVLLLARTGLRISEALGVDLEDLTTEGAHTAVTVVGKGGKLNTVPLPPSVVAELEEIRRTRSSGPLFVSEVTGERMTRQGAARALTRMRNRAGITAEVHPHVLRSTFVTEALREGSPLERVQRAVRHSDPRTTMRYYRAAEDLDLHPAYLLDRVHTAAR